MFNGSLIAFRSSLLYHGNIPYTGFRNSIVLFTCARMVKAMFDNASNSDKVIIDKLINFM